MALYNHFPDKQAILMALAGESFGKLGKALPKPGGANPLATLRKAMLEYITFGLKHRDEYELLFMARRSSDARADSDSVAEGDIPDDAGGRRAFGQMLEYVDAALSAGSIQGERFMVAKSLWAGIHGCVSLQITLPRFPFGSPKSFAEPVVDILLAGTQTGRP